MRVPAALVGGALATAASAQTMPPAYKTHCQMCHQATGNGLPGQFPRLAGRIGTIAARPEGRAYLVDVLLHGQAGRIIVDGKPITGLMAGYARLSDADLSTILTWLARLGPGKPAAFTIAEIRAGRARPKQGAVAVKAQRDQLAAAGIIP